MNSTLRKRYMLIFSILLFIAQDLSAQKFVETITSWFEFDVGKHRLSEDTTLFVNRVVIAPVATYEPSTSLGLGIGAKLLFKPKKSGSETRTSNLPLSLQYTLKNQFIFYSGFTVFFDQEKYLLKGNLEFSKFPLSYYGIGSLTVEGDQREITFNNFLLQPLLLRRVAPNLFAGGGWRYNTNRRVELLESDGELPEGTSLQDELGSTSSGLELAITYDSRDNVLNAQNGNFLEFTHGFYQEAFGSTHNFMLSKLDFRQYLQLSSNRPYDALALQWFARMTWNDTPPLELSALGGPALLRGFQDNRFRDKIALFAQAEYRWQTFERIGFVFFGGLGDVNAKFGDFNFTNLKYDLGVGFRLKIVQSENLNIRFDYGFGFGPENDRNFYLGIAESF